MTDDSARPIGDPGLKQPGDGAADAPSVPPPVDGRPVTWGGTPQSGAPVGWGSPPQSGAPVGWGAAGAPLTSAPVHPTKFCQACGQPIDARAEICPKCGVRQPWIAGMTGAPGIGIGAGDSVTRTGKSKTAAALIAIFLGGLGIHKFYLGDTMLGVIYLVFFWTFIPAIVGFIEGVLWLVQSNEQWLAKYGSR